MRQTTCAAPECPNKRGCQGRGRYCAKHAGRLRSHGSLDLPPRPTVEDRFWAKVDKNGPLPKERPELGNCWVWTAATYPDGYGSFSVARKSRGAHRVAYEMAVGPVPVGLVIDHLCRRPSCVRYTHLEAVPQLLNIDRGELPKHRARYVESLRTKTHCKWGHEFTPENTAFYGGKPYRICRACKREYPSRRNAEAA